MSNNKVLLQKYDSQIKNKKNDVKYLKKEMKFFLKSINS